MNRYEQDSFFHVPRTPVPTSAGPAELPALYYDVSHLAALFRVDYERAAAKLRPLALQPGLFWGGHAVVALALYEYRASSLGPYNEVGLAIPAVPPGRPLPLGGWPDMYSSVRTRRLGHHVLNLPVTTEVANAGGREIYGYPKFVTAIPFRLDEHTFSCTVLEPGSHRQILSLSGKLGVGIPGPAMSLVTYSVLDGTRLRTTVDVRGGVHLRRGGELQLCVGESPHEMARNLLDLGLHERRPFLVMETHRFQSRLNAPVPYDWTAA